ncbi:hypothetical protein AB0A60_02810 [Streptomyces sp. NPDC046275]|uniref:hypothetical protein n=1 Tax=Streptomyces sp. NPDC046275 TaxID=3157201 RepID=UPI0033E41B97
MAMVGLFWIAEGDVYVGAKPTGHAAGVRLAAEGVVGLGDGQSRLFLWEDVRSLTVTDIPEKTLMRQVGVVGDAALNVVGELVMPVFGPRAGDAPPQLTVEVGTSEGSHALSAYVAAAAGYPQSEVELSLALLSRLTEGAATMETTLAAMADWGRTRADGTPRRAEREALLQEWLD